MSIKKPSDKEQEYFAKVEAERRKKQEEEDARDRAEKERVKRRELHHMKCPKCGSDLHAITHKGIEIDKCGDCKGIWLDAGELEQLLSQEEGILKKILRFANPESPA